MDSEGPAQVPQVGRAIVAASLVGFGVVNAQMLKQLSKILADPMAVIRLLLRQSEEKRAEGYCYPQIGAQAQKTLQISGSLGSDGNQAIFPELPKPDIECALLGRVIDNGQMHGFGAARPAGIEEMVKGVMAVSAVKSLRIGGSSDSLLYVLKESPQFRRRKNIRTIRLGSRNGKGRQWIFPHPPASHQITAEPVKGTKPRLQGLGFEPALVLIH
jgi:hypothetical protein